MTALYREARNLHHKGSPQHLDVRRPDLQWLVLSDSNMNGEVSTLALSTEVLTAAIDDPELERQLTLATWPCDLPYHAPFNAICSALTLQGKRASDLNRFLDKQVLDHATESALGWALHQHCIDYWLIIRARAPKLSVLMAHLTLNCRLYHRRIIPRGDSDGEISNQLLALYGTDDLAILAKVETICLALGISRDRLNQALAFPLFGQRGMPAILIIRHSR